MSSDSFKIKKSLNIEPKASPTLDSAGDIGFDSTSQSLQVRDTTSTKTVATTAGAQVITNKDIDGGTASNSNRITVPSATKSTLDGLTRKEATIVYGTDTDKLYVDNGSTLTAVGSGSGGSKNYIDSEVAAGNAVTGWTAYADAAGSLPVDMTGGSPNADLTFATTTSSPLSSTSSILFTHTANNRQGSGWSMDISLDVSDRGKVLAFTMNYAIASGTYASGDLIFYAYDVTNSTLIQPTPYSIANHTLGSERFYAELQTLSTTASIRIGFHVATSTATAYTMKIDDLSFGPNSRAAGGVRGPVGSVIAHASLTAPMGYILADGTAVSRSNYAKLFTVIGTTYGVGDGSTTFNLPDLRGIFIRGQGSQTISSITYSGTLGTKQTDQLQGHFHNVGTVNSASDGAAGPRTSAAAANVTQATSSPITDGTNGTPRTGAETRPANIALAYFICFDDGVSVSSDADTRVVAAVLTGSPASASSGNPIIFPTVTNDTHGAYNSTTGRYTVATPGYYQLVAGGAVTAGTAARLQIYKNASLHSIIGFVNSTDGMFAASGLVYCIAGDVIDLRPNATVAGASANSSMSIYKLGGPAQIAASEKVGAVILGNPASATSGNPIIVPTVSYDSHGGYNASTGRYTVPRAGLVKVFGALSSASSATTLSIYKNASLYSLAGNLDSNGEATFSGMLYCVAGDIVDIRPGGTVDATDMSLCFEMT